MLRKGLLCLGSESCPWMSCDKIGPIGVSGSTSADCYEAIDIRVYTEATRGTK